MWRNATRSPSFRPALGASLHNFSHVRAADRSDLVRVHGLCLNRASSTALRLAAKRGDQGKSPGRGRRSKVKLGDIIKERDAEVQRKVASQSDDAEAEVEDEETSPSDETKERPQGLVLADDSESATPEPPEREIGYPTVIQQAYDNMMKYPECAVLTRVGGFWELYLHQAEHWAPLLGVKLTTKQTRKGKVRFAGFPIAHLERYLRQLVYEHGVHVALADEVRINASQRVSSGGNMFDRQIKRIVTPGTLIDEDFLAPTRHNYLLSITDAVQDFDQPTDDPVQHLALAWADLSSGKFQMQTVPSTALNSAVSRVAPGEVVLQENLRHSPDPSVNQVLSEYAGRTTFRVSGASLESGDLFRHAIEGYTEHTLYSFTTAQLSSAQLLLEYVQEQLPDTEIQLQQPELFQASTHMSIDRSTLRGLELRQRIKDGVEKGSLLHTIDRTSTRGGARTLRDRLISPSTDVNTIEERLDLVSAFLGEPVLIEELTVWLRQAADSERLVQAIAIGRGDAQDLLSIARTIDLTRKLSQRIQESATSKPVLQQLISKFEWNGPLKLAERIQHAIDEHGLMERYRAREHEAEAAKETARESIGADALTDMEELGKKLSRKTRRSDDRSSLETQVRSADEIWVMRKSASRLLSQLHGQLSSLKDGEEKLEERLKHQLKAPSLALRNSPRSGYIVHLRGKDTKVDFGQVIPQARMVDASKSTRSILVPEWTSLGRHQEDAKSRILREEEQILRRLREGVCESIVPLRRNAAVLDEIDVACSGALLANERNLVRPILDEDTRMHITAGRHLTVEAGLQARGLGFTANDIDIGQRTKSATPTSVAKSIHLITGPNMAGKSTYLRQTAIFSILAQTGLYVPASYARLGLVDAVFSRIGSADDLYQDQSTFMVEMLETADILRNATERSLVVMDEIGRGTSPEDGLAVGYAVLETLRRKKVGKVLFATHCHDLVDLCKDWPEGECHCTRVEEVKAGDGNDMSFRFDHKMRPGINRDSQALKCARLAGLPKDTIGIAQEVLVRIARDKE